MVAYKCASCEKTFSEKSNLLEHLLQHIAKTPDSDSDILEKSEPEVVVKEEMNSIVNTDDDFLQNFDKFSKCCYCSFGNIKVKTKKILSKRKPLLNFKF
jgi:hypothetical protein